MEKKMENEMDPLLEVLSALPRNKWLAAYEKARCFLLTWSVGGFHFKFPCCHCTTVTLPKP